MIRCVIIDDNDLSRSVLKQMIGKDEELNLISEFSDALSALNYCKNNSVDLLFLDIEMPGMSGIEFLETLRERAPLTILTTSYRDFALDAFQYNVSGYLVKPFSHGDFAKAVLKVKGLVDQILQPEAATGTFFVKSGSAIVKLDIAEVNLVECIGDYVNLHTKEKKYTVHSTMKNIEQKFIGGEYLRVHRSYIVRIDKIEEIEDDCITIAGRSVPIGRTYRGLVYDRLNIL